MAGNRHLLSAESEKNGFSWLSLKEDALTAESSLNKNITTRLKKLDRSSSFSESAIDCLISDQPAGFCIVRAPP
jgi:hypothetical protein